jgi:hypothetical protein
MDMPRDDGKKYGAGGQLIQEIMEPQEPVKKPSVKRGFKKSNPVALEETVRDSLPSDVEFNTEEEE